MTLTGRVMEEDRGEDEEDIAVGVRWSGELMEA